MARMLSLAMRSTSALRVGDGAGVDAASNAMSFGSGSALAKLAAPGSLIGGGEADDFGGDVVDEAGALGVDGVEIFEEGVRVVTKRSTFEAWCGRG